MNDRSGNTSQDQRAFESQRYYGDERREYSGGRGGEHNRSYEPGRGGRELGWRDTGRGDREPIYGGQGNIGGDTSFGRGNYGGRDYDQSWRERENSYNAPWRGSYGTGMDYGSGEEYGANWRGQAGYGQNDYGRESQSWRPAGQGGSAQVGEGYRRGDAPEQGVSNRQSMSDRGPHSGRGPRGYQRSDDRIREEVSDRLTQHGWLDASELDVEVNQGEVTLQGEVDDRYQKRLAEDIAEQVPGVKDIHNRLKVHNHGQMMGGPAGETGQSNQQNTASGQTSARNNRSGATAR